MTLESLNTYLDRFPGLRILVVGDVMLDEYIWGDVRRISPEAPVPVVEIQRRSWMPGGAANTAANVAGLGGRVSLGGVVGNDDAGGHIHELLQSHGVDYGGLYTDPDRPTTTKTRVIAHSQQIVRVDSEMRAPLSMALAQDLLVWCEKRMAECDACILSDYNKGVLSEQVAQSLIDFAQRYGKPVIVDPKGTNYRIYRNASVIKPNLHEAEQATQITIVTEQDVIEAGEKLLGIAGDSAILLTRGAEGMSLFCTDEPVVHIPAVAHNVFDVTGAGDTVVSAMAMALAAGASLQEGAEIANRAASIVVGKVGAAAITLEELRKLKDD